MDKNYQVLARRYRPQKFTDVVGQENVVKTIKNSLSLNRTSHAYLFSGPRGIGKTTLARLFAKALNCQNLTEDFEPCNECVSCREIASGKSLDTIEIDGASNRGIDDIRQLNETIGYAPSSGKYKIYIIDEVHMLTKEAFNALLKTLEEPPATVKFFFATTESHKVLPTIISRCQRFDLMRLSSELIVNKLKQISLEIKREITDEALYLIANYSQGSLRDGEVLLDQLFCFEMGKIDENIINNAIGFIDKSLIFEFDNQILNSNTSYVFEFIDKIYQKGKDLNRLIEELIDHYRTILCIKTTKKCSHFSYQKKYFEVEKFYSFDQCVYILDILLKSLQNQYKSQFQKFYVEMLLLKILKSKKRVPIDSIIKRLIQIEEEIKNNPTSTLVAKKEYKTELKEVPFSISQKQGIKKVEKVEIKKITKDEKNKNDTIMRFAAVELEGVLKDGEKS